jgi:hypothetical protein
MKLFSRLFRQAASPPPPPQALEDTRAHDEHARIAAIDLMPDGDELRKLAGFGDRAVNAVAAPEAMAVPFAAVVPAAAAVPAAVERAAQARLARLVDAGAIALAELCGRADFPRLVLESASVRLRQLAAAAIDDPVQLRHLIKKVRNKDKAVYKILKHKIDAQNAADRESQRRQSEVSALCAALVRHSQRTYDTFYEATFIRLSAQWRDLAPRPDAATETEATAAIERCREIIAAQAREAAAKAADDAALLAQHEADRESRLRLQQAELEAAAAQAQAEEQLRREAAASREAEEKARAEERAAQERIVRQLAGLIRKAHEALRNGNSQQAAGLRRALDEKLPAAKPLPASLGRQLQHLDDELNELKRWKDYAVAPKRIELIQEMESLIGSTEEPRVLAERIKALQEDWRTISKGIVSDAADEWERFHQASQAAYQPCREYFEAQAKLREANLARRRSVLERLTIFESAHDEQPDWPLLGRVLREAPREWRGYAPVDRDAAQAIQSDFDAALARLRRKLDAWHEANVAGRQALIERARALAAQDGRDTLDAVKRLQVLWKEAGPVPRERDQALWSEFRELCDAVYQKRQQAIADHAAALEAAKIEAAAVREAAEQRIRAAERAVDHLFEAGRHLEAYEWAAASGAHESERESLKRAAEVFIAGIEEWPKGALAAVRERFAAPGLASDEAAREKALRTLCIRCEILSDTATPREDEALRREYQVRRLMQGIGQGHRPDEADWDVMLLEWIKIGAVTPAVHEGLRQRFASLVRRQNSIRLRRAQNAR